MTKREQEILEFIREDPFITQQDIADKADITRSSVAVHIRNLTQKGLIKGRAYVLADEFFVLCIGNASIALNGNLDMSADMDRLNDNKYDGEIITQTSGIAKNVVEHLIKADVNAGLITVITKDTYGDGLKKAMDKIGIDTSHLIEIAEGNPSMEIMISMPNRSQTVLIEDSKLMENLTVTNLEKHKSYIEQAKILFIDDSLPTQSAQYIFDNFEQPIFLTISCPAGALRFKPYLKNIDSIVLNVSQTEAIVEHDVVKYRDLRLAAEEVVGMGVTNVYIAQENGGVYYANDSSSGRISEILDQNAHRQGLADAFSAGIIHSYLNKETIKTSAQYGSIFAKIASETLSAANANLDTQKVENLYSELFYV